MLEFEVNKKKKTNGENGITFQISIKLQDIHFGRVVTIENEGKMNSAPQPLLYSKVHTNNWRLNGKFSRFGKLSENTVIGVSVDSSTTTKNTKNKINFC